MNTIIENYNLQIKKFQKIESGTSDNEIYEKGVILERIFPILRISKINASQVKNGEKAIKLFGKLRDIQVQQLKLESIDQTLEIKEYSTFLEERELDLKEKVHKFFKNKVLEFPTIKKKSRLNKAKVIDRTEKSLKKLIEKIQSKSIDDVEDLLEIKIKFEKFHYRVEILSYLVKIEDANLEMLNMYQDKLGDIQEYEVLIKGIRKYFKKHKLEAEEVTEIFEGEQNSLIENFDNGIEIFIAFCREVICLNKQ
jgi:CHAD domain-containing protein